MTYRAKALPPDGQLGQSVAFYAKIPEESRDAFLIYINRHPGNT